MSGGDFGWRGRTNTWPPYDADHADFTPPTSDIGKGSPTAVRSGARSSFPDHYQRALFALDWAYGRIIACHLVPRGAGYVCRAETFLKGRPLNVTDVDFGPDGSMFIITGGRKTHSDLYRVRWVGDRNDASEPRTGPYTEPHTDQTPQQIARNEFSRLQRAARVRLSAWHGRTDDSGNALSVAWDSVGHADPMLRSAARVALESQPVETWNSRAFDETRPSWIVSAMLSLARSEHEEFIPRILQKLLEVPYESLSGNDRSMLLETWSRCLSHPAAAKAPGYTATVERIRAWYPDLGPPVFAPTGAGRSVNHQLALLAQQLQIPDLVPKTLILLARAHTPQQRLHAVFVLRNCRTGWTPESRQTVFETLGTLDRTVIGGEGMPGFLRRIREELIGTLTESERLALGDLLQSGVEAEQPPLIIDRPVVKKWQSDDLDTLLADNATPPNHEHGRELFRIALCSHCHRAGSTGGVVGPDLTSVARRFSRRDLLLSILEPSRVVDEKYRHEQIVTMDGRVIIGRLVTGGDYRATKLRLATDPLRPGQMVEIDKNDIETHQPSLQSPMPNGLLDTLSASDIRDLLAYLEHMAVFE
ncbi:MAG: c-type cytochrome [Fuerstiella sp.]